MPCMTDVRRIVKGNLVHYAPWLPDGRNKTLFLRTFVLHPHDPGEEIIGGISE
jgi:hypothetical protein